MNWIHVAHGRVKWQAVVNMIMILRVTQKAGIFYLLSNCQLLMKDRVPTSESVCLLVSSRVGCVTRI